MLSIFEMNEVKNVLLLLLRQEAIHGDQIGLLVLQRRTVAGQTFLEDETMSVIIRYLSRGYIREVVIDIGRSALSSN